MTGSYFNTAESAFLEYGTYYHIPSLSVRLIYHPHPCLQSQVCISDAGPVSCFPPDEDRRIWLQGGQPNWGAKVGAHFGSWEGDIGT